MSPPAVLTSDEVLALYRDHGAMLEGHFKLSSGLHSDTYFQSARVLMIPEVATRLGDALARKFGTRDIDVVVGPALGAVIVAHEVARGLGRPALFAERVEGRFALRRGFSIEPGARVALVEDVITTGGSLGELENLMVGLGGVVTARGCLVDRSGTAVGPDWPVSLAQRNVRTWPADTCELCARGVPVDSPGSRHRNPL